VIDRNQTQMNSLQELQKNEGKTGRLVNLAS